MIGAGTAPWVRERRLSRWLVALSTTATAALLGWLVVFRPTLAFLPVGLLLCIPLLISPRARILFLIFGGLLIFQSSQELSARKLLFLAGAAVAFVGSLVRSRRFTRTPMYRDLLPLFRSSIAFSALLFISLTVAKFMGTSQKAWLRDAAPYALFASAPLFVLDAATAFATRGLRRLVAFAGVAGTASFGVRWLTNHGIANLKSETIGYPTFLLGAALFAFGMAVVLEGRRGWLRWFVLTSLILATLVSTGTRSTATLLAAPLAIVLGTRERFARRGVRLIVAIPLAALLVLLGTQSIVRLVGANRANLEDRVKTLLTTGGSSDWSYLARVSQTKASWRLFEKHPILGTGPGYSIQWRDPFGRLQSSPSVDSSVSYLSKFGLAGFAALVVVVWAFVSFLRRLRRRTQGTTTTQLALVGFGAVIAAWSVLNVPFEDKGLASGLILLCALAASEASSARVAGPALDRR